MTITAKILHRIKCKGKGWVFTPRNFLNISHFNTINPLLDRLEKRGEIRSLGKGLYDYPIWDNIAKKYKSPSLDAIIEALEIQSNDRFLLSGQEAAYTFGVSKKPNKIHYLSSKYSKTLNVCDFEIKLTKFTYVPAPKNKYDKATLAILACKYIGKTKITSQLKYKIFEQLNNTERKKAIKLAKNIEWIHTLIKG